MNKNVKKYVALVAAIMLCFAGFFVIVAQPQKNATYAQESQLARAGGGEDFGGGGYDSGSSSSGSSFDLGSIGSSSTGSSIGGTGGIIGTCCTCLIIIAVVVIIIISKKKGGSGGSINGGTTMGSTPSGVAPGGNATNKSMTSEEIQAQLTKLKEIDPDFDEQKFKTHVKKVFMAVQEGWTNRDQAICRPFMGEEVYQSHQMQVDSLKKNKTINVLENIVVGSTEFARIDLGQDYHKIAMKIRAAMKDYKVKEDNPNVVISGDKNQSPPFSEFWVFIRKSNLKSKVKDGIFDRKCPNCGAPIDVDVAGTCKYCKANVVNGDFDWVLSEIIQTSEWSE